MVNIYFNDSCNDSHPFLIGISWSSIHRSSLFTLAYPIHSHSLKLSQKCWSSTHLYFSPDLTPEGSIYVFIFHLHITICCHYLKSNTLNEELISHSSAKSVLLPLFTASVNKNEVHSGAQARNLKPTLTCLLSLLTSN